MNSTTTDSSQTMQRLKVGMTGLALILLLIGLASAIISAASKDKPVDVAGGPKADVVANISITNDSAAASDATSSEPLAELGAAPSTADANQTAPANQTIVVPPPIVIPTQPASSRH